MGNLLYAKIRRDTILSKDIHNNILNLVSLGRERLESKADYLIGNGRISYSSANRECMKIRNNLYELEKMDAYLDKVLPEYDSYLFKKVLNN